MPSEVKLAFPKKRKIEAVLQAFSEPDQSSAPESSVDTNARVKQLQVVVAE